MSEFLIIFILSAMEPEEMKSKEVCTVKILSILYNALQSLGIAMLSNNL